MYRFPKPIRPHPTPAQIIEGHLRWKKKTRQQIAQKLGYASARSLRRRLQALCLRIERMPDYLLVEVRRD